MMPDVKLSFSLELLVPEFMKEGIDSYRGYMYNLIENGSNYHGNDNDFHYWRGCC